MVCKISYEKCRKYKWLFLATSIQKVPRREGLIFLVAILAGALFGSGRFGHFNFRHFSYDNLYTTCYSHYINPSGKHKYILVSATTKKS